MRKSLSTSKRAGVAAITIAALMLVGAACGGSSSKSSSSSDGTTATTASSGGGSSSVNCGSLSNYLDQVDTELGQMNDVSSDDLFKKLDQVSSKVPASIRADWTTVVDALKNMIDAMKGIDMTNVSSMSDPTIAARIEAASAAFEDPSYTAAFDRLQQWSVGNCPGLN